MPQTNHSCNYNGKQSTGAMKAKTSDVWVQEMFEAIFILSAVMQNQAYSHCTCETILDAEVFPLLGDDGEA